MIRDGHHRTVKKSLYFINILFRNMNIIPIKIHFNSELLEFSWNDSKMIDACVLNGDITLRHSSKSNKRTDFDHIGQHAVFSTAEIRDSFSTEHIAANAMNFCS